MTIKEIFCFIIFPSSFTPKAQACVFEGKNCFLKKADIYIYIHKDIVTVEQKDKGTFMTLKSLTSCSKYTYRVTM